MSYLENLMYTLEYIGIVDVILPFIIIFTVVYAALHKSHILGKDSKKFDIVLSLVMGLAVVIPHVTGMYPPQSDVVEIMNRALPNVSMIIVAVVMVMLILGIIGGDVNFAGTSLGGLAIWAAIIAVAFIFLVAAEVFTNVPRWLTWIYDPHTMDLIVVILVFGIIIGFVTSDDKDKDKIKSGRKLQELSKGMFGGGK